MEGINSKKKVYRSHCICPECKGDKKVMVKGLDEDMDVCLIIKPCEFCGGAGLMKRITTIELYTI